MKLFHLVSTNRDLLREIKCENWLISGSACNSRLMVAGKTLSKVENRSSCQRHFRRYSWKSIEWSRRCGKFYLFLTRMHGIRLSSQWRWLEFLTRLWNLTKVTAFLLALWKDVSWARGSSQASFRRGVRQGYSPTHFILYRKASLNQPLIDLMYT